MIFVRPASLWFLAVVSLLSVSGIPAFAQDAAVIDSKRLDEEMKYVQGLMQLGFPDYARIVSDALAKVPGSGSRLRTLQVQSLILQKKVDEAKALLDSIELGAFDNWPAVLDAADAYYRVGMMDEYQKLYDRFFRQFSSPPSGQDEFYKSTAYKYSQMLKLLKKDERAFEVYGCALKARPSDEEQCQMWTEMAQLALRIAMANKDNAGKRESYIKHAKDYCEKVQWGGYERAPIWFGKTVVIYAQIEALRGERQKAMNVITGYLDILDSIHRALLKSEDPELIRLTPMAECRFLLGSLYQDEGMELLKKGDKKRGLQYLEAAVNHLFNVFTRYPTTTWAPQAGKRAEAVFDTFDSMRVPYTRPSDALLAEALKLQFREARIALLSRDYESTVEKFTAVLSVYPEFPGESASALASVAECYYQMKEPDYGAAVWGYLAERFGRNPKLSEQAGDALLVFAAGRKEMNDTETAGAVYNALIDNFDQHPRRATVLIQQGELRRSKGDLEGAMRYYEKLKPGDRGYEAALSGIAFVWKERKNADKEIESLRKYLQVLQPGYERNHAQCRLALALMNKDEVVASLKEYETAITWIKDPKLSLSPSEQTDNRKLLEMALFNAAASYSKMKEPLVPAAEVPKFMKKTIATFDEFVAQFPASQMAPKALLRKGILQSFLKESVGAVKTFEELGRKYPDSEEAKSRHYAYLKGLIAMGMESEAKQTVEEMLANAGAYNAAQFFDVAKILLGGKEKDLTLKVLGQTLQMVKDKAKERAIYEETLFSIGRLQFEARRFAETVQALDRLFQEYPRTGFTVDAAFMLSKSYCEVAVKEKDKDARLDLFNSAVKQLNRLTPLLGGPLKAQAEELRARSAIESGRIFEKRAAAELSFGQAGVAAEAEKQANAAFWRLYTLSDPARPALRPYMEEAFLSLIPYEVKGGRFSDVLQYCTLYIAHFPDGKYLDKARQWIKEATERGGTLAPEPADASGAASGGEKAGPKAPAAPEADAGKPPASQQTAETAKTPGEKAK